MKHVVRLILAATFVLAVAFLGGCGMFKVPSYNVKFYNGDALVYENDVRVASFVRYNNVVSDTAVPDGYDFVGYYDEDGVKFSQEYDLKKDAVFYAKYEAIVYNITYDLGDGISSDNPVTYTVETETFYLTQPYGQQDGFIFVGWTTDLNATPEKNVAVEKGSFGDLSFKANFEDDNKFYLYFETSGGSEIARLDNYTGIFDVSGQTPEKAGYNFVNWYYDSQLTIPVTLGTYVSTDKRSTVYAKWEVVVYTIGFLNCDLDPIEYTVESDDFTVPAAEKTGNTFLGYTYDGLQSPVSALTIKKGSHRDYVLTAAFRVNVYKVTFETFGGTEIEPASYEYGSAVAKPQAPEKEGCEFRGWCSDELCNNSFDFTSATMPANNLTLYADWFSDDNYLLSYSAKCDGNDFSADLSVSRASGSKVLAGDEVDFYAPAYTLGGVFKCWKKSSSSPFHSDEVYSYDNRMTVTMPNKRLTLYAEYESAEAFTYAVGGGQGLKITDLSLIKVFGNGISDADFSGGSISPGYLDGLDDGDYLFSVITESGHFPVTIRVTGHGDGLSYLKLDYDMNYPLVTLVFDGKPDCEYEYSLNFGAFIPCESGTVVQGYDKNRAGGNKVTVRRVDLITDSVTVNKDRYGVDKAKYYETTFSYNGGTYDYVAEDYDELQAIMGYFANVYVPDADNRVSSAGYAGGKAIMEFCIGKEFKSLFAANEDEYVQAVVVNGSLPYYPAYSNSYNSTTAVETVTYFLSTSDLNTERSSQVETIPADAQALIKSGAREAGYDGFKINSFSCSQTIRSLYELEALKFGVRPVFTSTDGQAYAVYEKAKSILREYVSDEMNDFQKVSAIYDYLALNVTYDRAIADLSGTGESFGRYSCFTSYGALVENVAVCDGISSAFRLLCAIEGIEAEECTGFSVIASGSSEIVNGHAWNKVRLGGNWYGVDATWVSMDIRASGETTTYVRHSHFMISEAQLYLGGHRENAVRTGEDLTEGVVETAAYGALDYYDIEIYGSGGLTRNVKKRDDLNKLINYYKSLGADLIEIRNSSAHSIDDPVTGLINGTAATGTATIDAERGIYYVFI